MEKNKNLLNKIKFSTKFNNSSTKKNDNFYFKINLMYITNFAINSI